MDNKKTKSNADKLHNVKMKMMLEDSIQITDPNKNYIKINGKKIEDIIRDNAEKMLTINGELDPANIVNNDMVDLNLLSLYDSNNNLINYDLEGVKKGSDYWENKTDEYIKTLQDRLNADLSSISKDELKELIVIHNKDFLTQYIAGISANALNLANESTRLGYANRLANALTDLQVQDIAKISGTKFLELDLDKKPYQFIYYIDLDILKRVQEHIKETIKKLDTSMEDIGDKNSFIYDLLKQDLIQLALLEQIKKVDKMYQEQKSFYDKRNRKRKKIDKLLQDISKKYKELNDYFSTPRYRAMDTDNSNIVEEMQLQDKNLESAKFNTTLLSNKLFTGKDIESGTPYQFSFKEKTNLEDITTSITIYDSKSNIIQLSKEHRDINDAVGSLLDNGIRYLTLKQLYNFINKGIISNDPVDQDKIDNLLKDLYKMDRKADIDATEQFKLKGYQEYLQEYEKKTGTKARPVISQNLINFKILKNIPLPNGEQIDIICFMDYPAIYDYARQYRQLAPYPVEILNLNYSPKGNKKDNTTQINEISRTIRNELIRNIELRKSGFNQPLVINNFLCNECQFYDVIDKDVIDKNKIHTKILNKQKRVRYTNTIEVILNNFKDKGYIKDYKINKLGKVNKYSITFTFNKDN